MAKESGGLLRYLKAAFSWRWNLLALGSAIGIGVLSPVPEVVLPMVAAAELAYLAGLISIPKFRQAIDMQTAAAGRPPTPTKLRGRDSVEALLRELAPGLRKRFLELRERCLTMRRIARGLSGSDSSSSVEDLRTPGLDKLLWVFLRLLYSHQGLTRFLDETDATALEKQIDKLEQRRSKLVEGDERLRKSLTDAIATTGMRLENLRNAERNAEFVSLELDRIQSKILALSEMAVNNQSPDFITSQVDAVAAGMAETESAIKELNYITGLGETLEEAPSILERSI
ncbi:MAG: hypothetical protein KDI71_22345 [Xanthomonadales bacterium]|nr:hypothetical protein [Xanthomonadales bacterium]